MGSLRCVRCGDATPQGYVYRAVNEEKHETVTPLCGRCLRKPGNFPNPWKWEGGQIGY